MKNIRSKSRRKKKKNIKKISELVMAVLLIVCLASCATVKQGQAMEASEQVVAETSAPSVPAISSEAEYELVGYKFVFAVDGNVVAFRYLDAVGDNEIPVIAKTLMDILPGAVEFSNPRPGEILIKLSDNLTADGFNTFVAKSKALIYDTIY